MYSPAALDNLPKRPFGRGVGLVGGLFTSWAVGVTVLVAGLAREGCATMEQVSDSSVPAGWALRHELDLDHPDASRVATLLLERGPPRKGRESIAFRGDGGALSDRLQSAGWPVVQAGGPEIGQLPRVRVIAPDGTVAWTGYFDRADLAAPGVMILDHVILTEVAHGRIPPPIVPLACAAPAESN